MYRVGFLNQPVSTPVMLVLVAVLFLIIYLVIQRGHKKSKDNSQKYLSEHPDAATLCLYAEDLPANGAEVRCIQGTVSALFEAKYIPQAKVNKGMACHVLPGTVEFNGALLYRRVQYSGLRRKDRPPGLTLNRPHRASIRFRRTPWRRGGIPFGKASQRGALSSSSPHTWICL